MFRNMEWYTYHRCFTFGVEELLKCNKAITENVSLQKNRNE